MSSGVTDDGAGAADLSGSYRVLRPTGARERVDDEAAVYELAALARELAVHGAPAELLARISGAVGDEARHAEAVGALARVYGGDPSALAIGEVPARDLLAIALENAALGCVGETWAALVASHQAHAATDPQERASYREIAAERARHAELAWALNTWLTGQLAPGERSLVAAARTTAVQRLLDALEGRAHDPVIGLSDGERQRLLAAGLDAALWSLAA